ncbi:MAG TPA: HD domain-containing protein [Anaerolineales bacterium]|nr:HD domain-containing protein [Anaerolineales bacterium]
MAAPRLLPPVVEDLLPALAGRRVWVVGGSVRDVLLDRPSQDVDFVVAGDALALGRRLANEAGADYFDLDADRGTGRMLLTTGAGRKTVFDFARLQGGSIEQDLRLRDFTLNAMAVAIDDPTRLIDPTGGRVHLQKRWLEACSPTAVLDDPVRGLRAVRLAGELDARIAPETARQVENASRLIGEVSAERLRDEFFRLLGLTSPSASIRLLDHLGWLTALLPELEPLRGLKQPEAHAFDALRHTLAVVDGLERLEWILPEEDVDDRATDLVSGMAIHRLGRFRRPLKAYLDLNLSVGRTRRQALYLAALLHDAGKAKTISTDPDGRIRFLGHEAVGAAMTVEACRRLALSLAETAEIESLVAHHLRPEWLERTPEISRRAIYRFYRSTGSTGVGVVLLSLADLLGRHVPPTPQDVWSSRLEVARTLLEAWFESRPEKVEPAPLLDGNEVMRLVGMTPGPKVGRLLEELREAQASGEIESVGDAQAFVRARFDQIESEGKNERPPG